MLEEVQILGRGKLLLRRGRLLRHRHDLPGNVFQQCPQRRVVEQLVGGRLPPGLIMSVQALELDEDRQIRLREIAGQGSRRRSTRRLGGHPLLHEAEYCEHRGKHEEPGRLQARPVVSELLSRRFMELPFTDEKR